MNQSDATNIVLEKILVSKPGFSLMTNSTQEFEKCFAFYYQNDSYIKSGDIRDMSVGQGPIIMCKATGKCFETGSAFSTEEYVKAFETCGDPYGQPTSKVHIVGWVEGAIAVNAIKCIKTAANLNLAQAKSIIDAVLKGSSMIVDLDAIDKVESVIQYLRENGFESTQLWSNQC
jgi:alpha-tubulin suppressor-like RCC1 family protein